MHRQYEDPRTLEECLRDAEARLQAARDRGAGFDELLDLKDDVDDLKERINFAWQDQEADEWE